MKRVQYYALIGGFSKLVDKLEKYLREHDVKIMKKKEVQTIDYDESTNTSIINVKDQQKQYTCERCILAVTKDVNDKDVSNIGNDRFNLQQQLTSSILYI